MSESYKGITIPEYSDAADGPAAFINAVDAGPVPRFASVADRNAAFASPTLGVLTFVSPNHFEWYNGSSWVALSGDYAPLSHTHSAANITSGVISTARLPSARTNAVGVVQLTSSVTSTSTTLAATASAVKSVNDRLVSHNHDSRYAKTSHAHAEYLKLSGGTMTGALVVQSKSRISFGANQLKLKNLTSGGKEVVLGTVGFAPADDGKTNLGSSNLQWKDVYATGLKGRDIDSLIAVLESVAAYVRAHGADVPEIKRLPLSNEV